MQKHINHMACLTEWAIDTWQEATHLAMNKTRCIAKAQKLATHLAFRSSEIGPAIPKNIPLISCSPHFSAHNMYFFSIFSTLKPEKQKKSCSANPGFCRGWWPATGATGRHALLTTLPWQQRSQLAMDPTPSQRSLGATSARKVVQVHHGVAKF